MSTTATITFRTDPELKADIEEILEDIGMNLSIAFNCFMNKVRDVGGIPFALSRKSKHNKLVALLQESKDIAHDPNTPRCTDSDKIEEFPLS